MGVDDAGLGGPIAADGLLPGPNGSNSRNQLSTMNGCFIPCLLNILGAVLFLRVGFAVGMMGALGALGIFLASEGIAYLTITSFSAIVTNGRMAGGGAYFMISRNLGPAFGGSSGIMFWFTYCLNVTFNTVSFTQTFQETFFSTDSWWGNADNWSQATISTITLFLLFLVAYKGAGAFAKINWFIFAALVVALAASIGTLFFDRVEATLPTITYQDAFGHDQQYTGKFTPWSWQTLQDNMFPEPVPSGQCAQAAMFGSGSLPGQKCSLQLVFSVIFPAVCGLMEGANLSGDLKDPGRSIPNGTVAAVTVALVCYVLLIIGQGGTLTRQSLQFDMNVMQNSTVGGGYFVVIGVAAACLSTALGSMFGSARILQAIARDDIFPCLSFFKKGTAQGDEPRRAVVLSFLLAECGILLGGLDDVAPILTNFFLLVYCLTNFACFLLVVSRVPNFRPTFRCYSWQTSLFGSVSILAVMFYLNWFYALLTLLLVVVLYAYIQFRFRGRNDWIDISQAMNFRWARRGLLTMQSQKQDPKYWRPSLLLLMRGTPPTRRTIQLAGFLNRVKESGLFVVGQVLVGDSPSGVGVEDDVSSHHQRHADLVAASPGMESFPQLALASNGRLACFNLVVGSGLGTFVPDTVALALPESDAEFAKETQSDLPVDTASEYIQVAHDVVRLNKNLLIAANFASVRETSEAPPRVDMWIFGEISAPASTEEGINADKTQLSLLLQLGMICQKQGIDQANTSRPQLRLLQCVSEGVDTQECESVLRLWLRWSRIPRCDVKVVTTPGVDLHTASVSSDAHFSELNRHMHSCSTDANLVLAMLPKLPVTCDEAASAAHLKRLSTLTAGLPPTVLATNGQGFSVITSVI